jgi:DNA-binding MarR family transcriptional regulator
VRLLRVLLDAEHYVTQCTEELGLTQSALSKHLGRPVQAGLVTRRRSGRRTPGE